MEIPLARNTTCLRFPYFHWSHRRQLFPILRAYCRGGNVIIAAIDVTGENTETSDKLYFALVEFPLAKDLV